jgi:glutathione S-transferase
MMKLFWSSRSPFVRKVMIVAHELGVADRIEKLRTVVAPADPNPDLMPFNPLCKIPTMVLADGTVLQDSVVICEYLAAEAGDAALFPQDASRWTVLARHALADGIMEADLGWLNERRRDAALQMPKLMDGYRTKIWAALDSLENDPAFLGKQAVDIAGIALFCGLAHLDFRFPDQPWRPGRPQLAAWFDRFAARPSARATAYVDAY